MTCRLAHRRNVLTRAISAPARWHVARPRCTGTVLNLPDPRILLSLMLVLELVPEQSNRGPLVRTK